MKFIVLALALLTVLTILGFGLFYICATLEEILAELRKPMVFVISAARRSN